MGQNLEITKKLETYIENFSKSLHPIQKEIISYNESLGDIKRMQISISQCQFLELIINVVIPLTFALWLAGWIYSAIVGSSITKPINEPFWFIRSQRF